MDGMKQRIDSFNFVLFTHGQADLPGIIGKTILGFHFLQTNGFGNKCNIIEKRITCVIVTIKRISGGHLIEGRTGLRINYFKI